MTSTPTPNVRLTISVTPEVHSTFQRLAKAGGMSISRAMGEWLGDTVEAADFMALKMEQARAAPKIVMREMHAYALGLADETGQLMDQLREKGRAERSGAVRTGLGLREASEGTRLRGGAEASRLTPPSSNTGGKGPKGSTRGQAK